MKNVLVIITILTGIGMLLINSAVAFPPPSPDQEKAADEAVRLCESTGGVANKTSVGGYDPKTGIDYAWSILVDCSCPEGYNWNKTLGCIKICNTDEDCKSIECPSRNELPCTSVQFVKKVCINNQCVCKCSTEEWNLSKLPIGEEINYPGKIINYQGKIYVKTDERYHEYIPEEYRVDLKDGTSIYVFDNAIYILYAADPHHGSYTYVKWVEKESEINNILLYVGAGVIILVICFLFWKLRKK